MPTYTVIADAVTIRTGRINKENRRPEVVRITKGGNVEGPADSPTILTLLSTKGIRPSDEVTGTERITPRHVMRIFKNAVTAKPNKAVEAIDAPLPVTDPNEL